MEEHTMSVPALIMDPVMKASLDAGFAAAFGGAFLAIRLMRVICANRNFGMFAFYCWGVSLFTFILYLTI